MLLLRTLVRVLYNAFKGLILAPCQAQLPEGSGTSANAKQAAGEDLRRAAAEAVKSGRLRLRLLSLLTIVLVLLVPLALTAWLTCSHWWLGRHRTVADITIWHVVFAIIPLGVLMSFGLAVNGLLTVPVAHMLGFRMPYEIFDGPMPHTSVEANNPYRIPEPKDGILFEGAFLPADERGRYVGNATSAIRLKLTSDCLWLSKELSVPVDMIVGTELFWGDRAIRVTYVNSLERRREEVLLCAMDLLGIGLYSESRVRALGRAIEQARQCKSEAAPSTDTPSSPPCCERCADKAAAIVYCYDVLSLGFYPLLGVWRWSHRRRLLCRKHSLRMLLACGVSNALLGSFGFPGILAAPLATARSLWSFHKAHKAGWQVVLSAAAIMLLIPAALALVVLMGLGVISFW